MKLKFKATKTKRVHNGPVCFTDGEIKNIADVQGAKLIEQFPDNFRDVETPKPVEPAKKAEPSKDKAMKPSKDK